MELILVQIFARLGILASVCLLLITNSTFAEKLALSSVATAISDQPLAFTKNMGQWPDSILFRANANGAVMWFTKDGIYQQFFRRIPRARQHRCGLDDSSFAFIPNKFEGEKDSIITMLIKTTFVEGSADVQIETGDMLTYKCNYFLGNDSTKWATDAPNYASITYKNIYDGIDLRYYGNGKHMEYDFVVSSGVDPMVIKLRYDNVESVELGENGDLLIRTKWSDIIEQKPVVYSEHAYVATPVDASFALSVDNGFAFVVEEHDLTQTLIIDPVLVFSTYLGGDDIDIAFADDVDELGNVYLTGYTASTSFPTINAIDSNYAGGEDVYVAKLSESGILQFSTYLGGAGEEGGYGIAIMESGFVCVGGYTLSEDFPTQRALDDSLNGPSDIFVAKLSPNGDTLMYSSYLGGSSSDQGGRVAVDQTGRIYVAGYTASSDFPTVGAIAPSLSGNVDVCLSRFSTAGDSLEYSTYLGGTNRDLPWGIALDRANNVSLVGMTRSGDFPLSNALDSIYGGQDDAFVAKISSDGSTLLYSTFLGGTEVDWGTAIDVDTAGNAYVAGFTQSTDFPLANAQDSSFNGLIDIFVAKLSVLGDNLVFATYIGGNNSDEAFGIALDAAGSTYICGYTGSSDFPTQMAFDNSSNGGHDAIITQLSSDGGDIVFSTFLGGSADDEGHGIHVDDIGNLYLVGYSESFNFPTMNAIDANYDGAIDIFVSRFTIPCCNFRGDANHDGILNIVDLNYLVAYFFLGGSAPSCEDGADANGNGVLNVEDLNQMVAYFFLGGSPPVACL